MASLNKFNKYLYNMNPMMGNQLCNLFLNTTLCCNWLINLMLWDQLCKLLNVLLIQIFYLFISYILFFTHFLFIYKTVSFLFLIFWNIDMKCWRMEKYKTSAKLGFWEPNLAIMLEVWLPKLCFRRCQLFKKIEWVLFLPIVGVFWEKKKISMGFHGLIKQIKQILI